MSRSLQERLAALEHSVSVRASVLHSQAMNPNVLHPALQGVPPLDAVITQQLTDLGFTRRDEGLGPYWRRTLRYDILTYHGSLRFGDAISCPLDALARTTKVRGVQSTEMRFYDTETTGLGTGAGTIPFLHAVGQFEEDEFVIHQYFLHDYSEEGALLQAMTALHFTDTNAVVSFNGKSFDWPLYKSRMAMYRMEVPTCQQVDLLYPSRRLWKHKLPRVSLSGVESGILGLTRTDDLPGKEAPSRYFAYVESYDAGLVDPVFEHNATDVCSLVVLTALLSNVLAGEQSVESAGEFVALGRLYDEWREYDLADRCFDAARKAPDVDWRARWLGSLHHKRRGQWQQACAVWAEMATLHPWSVSPAVELAKYFEHRERNLENALMWARVGVQRALAGERQRGEYHLAVPSGFGTGLESDLVRALRHRVARIQAKLHTDLSRH